MGSAATLTEPPGQRRLIAVEMTACRQADQSGGELERPATPAPCQSCLSPRELEVVGLLVDGLVNQEIAERLGLSRRTVHAHLSNAMAKTLTRTRTQLAVYALRHGLVPLAPPESTDE